MNYLTIINEINSLGTLFATFPALHHTWLNLYSTSDNQGCKKTVDLPQRFRLFHHVKQIAIRTVFWCSPLTLCQFALSVNSIHQQFENETSGSRKEIIRANEWTILPP